ncbi:MAG: IS4 family transposase [Chitinispirillia bacterium]|jgi:hypothetical protein
MCQESIKGTLSYNDLASRVSMVTDCDASRQAFFYRTKEEAVEFFQSILAAVMKLKVQPHPINKACLAAGYKRILVQDSTIVRLPNKLFDFFSGVKNAHTSVCNARIQGVYDLISGTFISFSIDPYSVNDQKVSHCIDAQKGDLVLRDRGYYVIQKIQEILDKGADVISRYKHLSQFYDLETKEPIHLLTMLKNELTIDRWVLTGEKKDIKVRILATPTTEEIANLRRMKAKKENKTKKYSPELGELMGWNIFITSIKNMKLTIQNIAMLYSLRWRIECIFKTWKSNFKFARIHNVSKEQLKVLLRARMIMITILYVKFYNQTIGNIKTTEISLMKFIRFVLRNLKSFVSLFNEGFENKKLWYQVKRYCTYDKRKRKNYEQIFNGITNWELT